MALGAVTFVVASLIVVGAGLATAADASIAAGGQTLSNCAASVGASARPSHHDRPMTALPSFYDAAMRD